MKRILDSRFKWTDEDLRLELLDWERNPSDFDTLCEHIVLRLNAYLLRYGKTVDDLVERQELRNEIRRSASRFREKFVSLPNYVYLKLKVYVANRMKSA
jgi:hypothetical protein